jgi:hypothetical protein
MSFYLQADAELATRARRLERDCRKIYPDGAMESLVWNKLPAMLKMFALFAGLAPSMTASTEGNKNPLALAPPRGAMFGLSVANEPALAKWYVEKLGFRLLKEGASPDRAIKFALLDCHGAILEIIQRPDALPLKNPVPDAKEAYVIHGIFKAGFIVAGIENLRRTLTERQVGPSRLGRAADLGLGVFWITDPESNMVQFVGE